MEKNRFAMLNSIDCGEHLEEKNTGKTKLSYVSWAWAWQMFKNVFPDSYYTIYESDNGRIYFTDGRTCWVKTGVTLVDGEYKLEHIEYLPIMDNRNQSLPLDCVTSTDVNKAIQRSLTKAVARHGLGLYVYAGEDLPADVPTAEEIKGTPVPKVEAPKPEPKKPAVPAKVTAVLMCDQCGKEIKPFGKSTADQIADKSFRKFGQQLCIECAMKRNGGME